MISLDASPKTPSELEPGAGRVDGLDGIRAVAVFLVIGFHVGVPGMTAGFLGVDVFFVLSGYLITTLLLRDVQIHGSVRLSQFWTRRVRRLMPAFLLLVVAVMAWGATLAPTYQLDALRGDIISSLLYVANWHFIGQASYFADDGSESPLQHVWSLAVEEQFYLIWPLVIVTVVAVAVRRQAHRPPAARVACATTVIGATALALSVLSLVLLALLHDPTAPDRAYMGTDARAFEPLLGAWLAVALGTPQARRTLQHRGRVITLAGLAVIVACVLLLGTPKGAAPAYYSGGALALSLGSIAVIATVATGTAPRSVGHVLQLAPLTYLGRISYGIYLWHWPLTLWLLSQDGFSFWSAGLVAVLSVALAAASYHVVEKPIRDGRISAWLVPRRLVPLVAVALAASAGTAFATVQPHVDSEVNDVVVMVGDSVPARMMPALSPVGAQSGLTVTSAARGNCPALGVSIVNADGSPLTDGLDCSHEVPSIQSSAIEAADPAVVIWWSRYELSDRVTVAGQHLRAGSEEFWRQQRDDLSASVARLTTGGAHLVLVLTDRPGLGMYSRCTEADCHPFLRRLVERDDLRNRWNAEMMAVAASDPRVHTVQIDDVFCTDDQSPCDDSLPDGTYARPDGSHFSDAAMPAVARALLDRAISAVGLTGSMT